MDNINPKTRKIAYLSILLSSIWVLSFIEHNIPPLPFLPPNFKLGLSNIVTMYCLFFIGRKEAVALLGLKSLFVLLTRGAFAGVLSLSGGMLSVLSIILFKYLSKDRVSYIMLSIIGAIFHNLGQIVAASIVVGTPVRYYLPFILVFGIIMGAVTGALLKIVMPYFDKIFASR